MVSSSLPVQEEQQDHAKVIERSSSRKWLQRLPIIVGTVVVTVVGMIVSLQVKAMFTPEVQKTMEQLYDLKKVNGVSLRDLNTTRAQQELALSQTKSAIADTEQQNARIDVCINSLQSGGEANDGTCDPATLKVSLTSSGSSAAKSSSSSSF